MKKDIHLFFQYFDSKLQIRRLHFGKIAERYWKSPRHFGKILKILKIICHFRRNWKIAVPLYIPSMTETWLEIKLFIAGVLGLLLPSYLLQILDRLSLEIIFYPSSCINLISRWKLVWSPNFLELYANVMVWLKPLNFKNSKFYE